MKCEKKVKICFWLLALLIFWVLFSCVFQRLERKSSQKRMMQNMPQNRVVGLLSDGISGSKAVCYNTKNWEPFVLAELPDVTSDNYASLSPNGTKLAYTTWSEDNSRRYLKILDLETLKTISYLDMMSSYTEVVNISWMPDGIHLLFIRTSGENLNYHTIEILNWETKETQVIVKGEEWKVRQVEDIGVESEDFVLPGSGQNLKVKYTEDAGAGECWNYYMTWEEIEELYRVYGGVRKFNFQEGLNGLYVEFSAPRSSWDGKKIVYSTKLQRTSAPGSQTPLWVASAIWIYDTEKQKSEIVYRQEDEGAIGRVDWISQDEVAFVSYYDFQGSRDDINCLNIETGEKRNIYKHTKDHYNNVTLLPIGEKKLTFTSSAKNETYEESKMYLLDMSTEKIEEISLVDKNKKILLELFVYERGNEILE